MKIRVIISLLAVILLTGCSPAMKTSEMQNPDMQGYILHANCEKKVVNVIVPGKGNDYSEYKLKVNRDTGILDKKTGKQLTIKDLKSSDKVNVWFTPKGNENYTANQINVVEITRSDLLAGMVAEEKGRYNIYIFSKDPGKVHQRKEVEKITDSDIYRALWKKISFRSYGGGERLHEKKFNINNAPAILILNTEKIVLRTHDFHELLNFFQERRNNVRLKKDEITFKGESKHWSAELEEDYTEKWLKDEDKNSKFKYSNYASEKLHLTYKDTPRKVVFDARYNYKHAGRECSGPLEMGGSDGNIHYYSKTQDHSNCKIARSNGSYVLTVAWNGKKETMKLKARQRISW
ncbi:MAG: hypothetical protein K9L17_02730 [Clostridiales bacterium]|nr:hypothetical protein [Clostridiales bacterium]MCF8021595.1 hypothetical protein [Clostridiales bacterium]